MKDQRFTGNAVFKGAVNTMEMIDWLETGLVILLKVSMTALQVRGERV